MTHIASDVFLSDVQLDCCLRACNCSANVILQAKLQQELAAVEARQREVLELLAHERRQDDVFSLV